MAASTPWFHSLTAFGNDIGAILLGVGIILYCRWRARLVTHPACRRCDYDLRGNDAVPQCPECGANLQPPRAVRRGPRRLQSRWRWAGWLALSLGVIGMAATAWRLEWVRHQPIRLLMMEAQWGRNRFARAAASALADRIDQLTPAQLDELTHWLPDPPLPPGNWWDDPRVRVQESAIAGRRFTDAQLSRLYRPYLSPSLAARPRVTTTGPLPVLPLRLRMTEAFPWRFVVTATEPYLLISDGEHKWEYTDDIKGLKEILLAYPTFGQTFSQNPLTHNFHVSLARHSPFRELRSAHSGLDARPGTYTATLRFTVTLVSKWDDVPFAGWHETVQTTFQIVPPDEPIIQVTTDPRWRPHITITRAEGDDLQVATHVRLFGSFQSDHPQSAAWPFRIFLTHNTHRWLLTDQFTAGPAGNFQTSQVISTFTSPDVVSLILAPNIEAAARTVDVTEIWGQDVLIKDIPVVPVLPSSEGIQPQSKP